jgi:asparagine N-glycosylation enzyme membrane subunit Stt3
VSLKIMGNWYGLLWIAALLAPIKIWHRGAFWRAYVPLIYGGGLVFFWLQTRDFNYYPPPVIAAGAAYLLEGLLAPWAWVVAAGLIMLPPLIPGSGTQPPWMTRILFRETMVQTDGLDQATDWLSATQGDLKPDSAQAYGLVTPWDLGNLIAQAGRTPVGWSQTVSPELASLVYSADPEETYRRLTAKARPFRYILVPARNLAEKFLGELLATNLTLDEMLDDSRVVDWKGHKMRLMTFSPRSQATVLHQLYWNTAYGLGHYRMVFESSTKSLHAIELLPDVEQFQFTSFPMTDKTRKIFQPLIDVPERPLETSRGDLVDAKIGPEVRIFELVPGALLTGSATPATQVRARITISNPLTQEERTIAYATMTDQDGRFSLRVPYATGGPVSEAPGTIVVKGTYTVEWDDQTQSVEVSEEEVKAGREVPVEQ